MSTDDKFFFTRQIRIYRNDELLEDDEFILIADAKYGINRGSIGHSECIEAHLKYIKVNILAVNSVDKFYQILKKYNIAVVVLYADFMPQMNYRFILEIKRHNPYIGIVMIFGPTDIGLLGISYGSDRYILWCYPWRGSSSEFNSIWADISSILEQRREKIIDDNYQKKIEQENKFIVRMLDKMSVSCPTLSFDFIQKKDTFVKHGEVVIFVDDCIHDDEIIKNYLQQEGAEVLTVNSIEVLRQMLKELLVVLVFFDTDFNQGIELIPEIKEMNHDAAIIVLSDTKWKFLNAALCCIRYGADDYLIKPIQFDPFWIAVQRVLEKRRLRINNRHYKQQLEQANLFLRQLLQRSQSSWQPLSNGNPPSWASGWGQDKRGVWLEFTLDGKNGPVTQRLRWIPPGNFLMGSPEDEAGRSAAEGPQHQVTISNGFWIFDSPVTQALWLAVMEKNPSRLQHPARPVEQVSWNDCQHFLRKINQRLPGLALTLPSEAQWEYACRADSTAAFYAESIQPIAWQQANSGGTTHPVREKQPNAWGLHDMLGNVWEWTADAWHENYQEALGDGSIWDEKHPDQNRVIRGGSWRDEAQFCRCAYRSSNAPDHLADNIGFRCLCVQD